MKSFLPIALTVMIALLSKTTAFAQNAVPSPTETPITLVFQPPPGELHQVVTTWSETEMDPQTKLAFGSQLFNIPTTVGETVTAREVVSLWRVLDRDPKGNTVIEITYKYIRSGRTFGRMVDAWATFLVRNEGIVVRWDTRRKTSEINSAFRGIEQMEKNQIVEFFIRYFRDIETVRQTLANYLIDRPFRIVVDKQGRVVDVQDMDLLLDQYRTEVAKLTKDFETRAKIDAVVTAFLGDDAVRQTLAITQLIPLPATPVAVGQKWSDTYEFNMVGMQVPFSREFCVTQTLESSSDVSGTITFRMTPRANDKDLNLVGTTNLTTTIYAPSGMFYELKQQGSIKQAKTSGTGASGVAPLTDVLMRFEGSTKINRMATRSTTDRTKWRFQGGYEDFHIVLGEHWYRTDPISSTETDVYVDSRDNTSITSAILPKGHQGILKSKEDIPIYLELFSGFTSIPIKALNFKMLKTFRTENVDWYRARVDLTYERFSEHMVVQGGFDGTRFFLFFLKAWGDDFDRKLAENTPALDTIEIRRQ